MSKESQGLCGLFVFLILMALLAAAIGIGFGMLNGVVH